MLCGNFANAKVNAWIIPDSTRKSDIYKKSVTYYPYRMLTDSFTFCPRQADALLKSLPEEEQQQACEYAFLRGEFGKEQEWYVKTTDRSKFKQKGDI